LCINDISISIIDILIIYGVPDWCVLWTVLLSLRIDDIIGSVFTTYGALFAIIGTVK
jgi:hypothetical protein